MKKLVRLMTEREADQRAAQAILQAQMTHRSAVDAAPGPVMPAGQVSRCARAYHAWSTLQLPESLRERLLGLYPTVVVAARKVTGLDLMPSPHVASAITLKVYRPGHEGHGWHRDTNPYTGLLYLTTSEDGRTEFEGGDEIAPMAGVMAVFGGKVEPHRSAACADHKVVVVYNLYTPDDMHRPIDADEVMYAG